MKYKVKLKWKVYMSVYNQKQQRPGYYAALRQNRKIVKNAVKRANYATLQSDAEKENASLTKNHYDSMIEWLKKANFWKRLQYLFVGDPDELMKVSS